MIPLRRQLIVKEHGNLTFPEGTACADVLVAGERGGSFAGRVFWGLGLGGVYTVLMNTFGLWPSHRITSHMASGRFDAMHNHLRVPRCRLHHRTPRGGDAIRRGCNFLACADAGHSLLRLARSRSGTLSQHDSHPANESRSALGNLHSPDRRRRSSRIRANHADQDDADNFRGARRGDEGYARQTS